MKPRAMSALLPRTTPLTSALLIPLTAALDDGTLTRMAGAAAAASAISFRRLDAKRTTTSPVPGEQKRRRATKNKNRVARPASSQRRKRSAGVAAHRRRIPPARFPRLVAVHVAVARPYATESHNSQVPFLLFISFRDFERSSFFVVVEKNTTQSTSWQRPRLHKLVRAFYLSSSSCVLPQTREGKVRLLKQIVSDGRFILFTVSFRAGDVESSPA